VELDALIDTASIEQYCAQETGGIADGHIWYFDIQGKGGGGCNLKILKTSEIETALRANLTVSKSRGSL
jgi:hypothetical protein